MNKQSKKINRSQKGNIISEAALVIPLMVGITFFIFEFGNVMLLSNNINQIARNTARFASVTPTYSQQDLLNAANVTSILPDASKLTLTVTPAPGATKNPGDTITVNAQYTYTPVINPFGLLNSTQAWAPQIMSNFIARSEVSSAS